MSTETLCIGVFTALFDQRNPIKVKVWQEMIITKVRGGTKSLPGQISFETDGGRHVNFNRSPPSLRTSSGTPLSFVNWIAAPHDQTLKQQIESAQ